MSELELIRNHKNYFGLTKENLRETKNNTNIELAEPFILITRIEWLNWRLGWSYDVWKSTTHFDIGGNPITDFHRDFWLENSELHDFKTSNSELLTKLDNRFRSLVLPIPSAEATFQLACFQTIEYRLNVDFSDNGKFPVCRLADNAYHETIAENIDVVAFDEFGTPGLIPILHQISSQKDIEFFSQATLILPN